MSNFSGVFRSRYSEQLGFSLVTLKVHGLVNGSLSCRCGGGANVRCSFIEC